MVANRQESVQFLFQKPPYFFSLASCCCRTKLDTCERFWLPSTWPIQHYKADSIKCSHWGLIPSSNIYSLCANGCVIQHWTSFWVCMFENSLLLDSRFSILYPWNSILDSRLSKLERIDIRDESIKFGGSSRDSQLTFDIVNRWTGYETLPWKQWCCNLCWKGHDPAQSFVLTFTPQLNMLKKKKTFRLLSCSNTFQILLLFVQGQGLKGKPKPTTKKFVRFHNHCLWLTMLLSGTVVFQKRHWLLHVIELLCVIQWLISQFILYLFSHNFCLLLSYLPVFVYSDVVHRLLMKMWWKG